MKISEVTFNPDPLSSGFISFSARLGQGALNFEEAVLFADRGEASSFARKFNSVSSTSTAVVGSTLNGAHLVFTSKPNLGPLFSLQNGLIAYAPTYERCVRHTKKMIEKYPGLVADMQVRTIDDVMIEDVEFSDPDEVLSRHSGR